MLKVRRNMISIYFSNKRNILDRKRKHQSCKKLVREHNVYEFAITKELKIYEKKMLFHKNRLKFLGKTLKIMEKDAFFELVKILEPCLGIKTS